MKNIMKLRKLTSSAVQNKTILLRTGFDVPVKHNKVLDDSRIKDALQTIRFLINNNCRIIIITHLKRPEGIIVPELRVGVLAKHLQTLINVKVKKSDYSIGIEKELADLKPREILMLENIRFHEEETSKNPTKRKHLAKILARYGDVYVNEAFSDCHREHASITEIPKYLPSYPGFALTKEIETIQTIMKKAKKPFIIILGGAKLKTKIPIIEHLLPKATKILLGGAMIFTFYAAKGINVGKSLVEQEEIQDALRIMSIAKKKLVLPVDVVAATKLDNTAHIMDVHANRIPSSMIGVDIGEVTITHFKKYLKDAKTILWNGPLGVYEIKKFGRGTREIAEYVANKIPKNTVKVIGGGDIGDVIHDLKLEKKMTLVSTGGGASLAMFSGKKLPGLKPLSD